MSKEALTRLMGLWGFDVDYQVPNALPSLPANPLARKDIEAQALRNRVDLEIAKRYPMGSPRRPATCRISNS